MKLIGTTNTGYNMGFALVGTKCGQEKCFI
jgi:hypothetical protein